MAYKKSYLSNKDISNLPHHSVRSDFLDKADDFLENKFFHTNEKAVKAAQEVLTKELPNIMHQVDEKITHKIDQVVNDIQKQTTHSISSAFDTAANLIHDLSNDIRSSLGSHDII